MALDSSFFIPFRCVCLIINENALQKLLMMIRIALHGLGHWHHFFSLFSSSIEFVVFNLRLYRLLMILFCFLPLTISRSDSRNPNRIAFALGFWITCDQITRDARIHQLCAVEIEPRFCFVDACVWESEYQSVSAINLTTDYLNLCE